MKTVVMIVALALSVVALGGCLEEIGTGAAGGYALSETVKGMQADLDRREQALLTRYNDLIAAGAKAEDLEQVKRQIADIQFMQTGTQTVDQAAKTDWTDPAAAGGMIGTIAALGYAFMKRRELSNTVAGVKTFRSMADEKVKHDLDSAMLSKGVA